MDRQIGSQLYERTALSKNKAAMLGRLTPSDTGQVRPYLNYAREHWTFPVENRPVGRIL